MKEQMKIEQPEIFKPKIEFVIDEDQDFGIFKYYWNKDGWTRNSVVKYLNEELKSGKITKEEGLVLAKKSLHDFYNNNYEELLAGKEEVVSKWQKVEPSFYSKVDQLLHHWPWPKGEYKGIATTAGSFPRNIRRKEFAFPAIDKTNMSNLVIAHEMLHFIVYDYLEKKFKLKPSESGDKDNSFWQFTENFNNILENSDYWKEFVNDRKSPPKIACQEQHAEMKKLWDSGITKIDDLVEKILIKK